MGAVDGNVRTSRGEGTHTQMILILDYSVLHEKNVPFRMVSRFLRFSSCTQVTRTQVTRPRGECLSTCVHEPAPILVQLRSFLSGNGSVNVCV